MLTPFVALVAAFAPLPVASPLNSRATSRGRACRMASPLESLASPLTFKAAGSAGSAVAAGSLLDDLPPEVLALFAIIPLVGLAGLVKSNMDLNPDAPTVSLGETRDELAPEAEAAEDKSQADKEKEYWGVLSAQQKEKREGGNKATKKKRKRR